MIDSVIAFIDKNDSADIVGAIVNNSGWDLQLCLTHKDQKIYFYLDQQAFIKLKNEILSLDRQYNERRKNATISKRT